MNESYLKLRGLSDINDNTNSVQLEDNLKLYLDWTLLGAGSWININKGQLGDDGETDVSLLRQAQDPGFTDGQVWEGYRKDWVWESGQSYTDRSNVNHEPVQISGVYLNDNFVASGYYIDYSNGRVVFDEPQTGTVQVEHSHRYIQVLRANDTPWLVQLQYGSFRIDQGNFQVSDSGNWVQFPGERVQMPAIIIDIVPARKFRPYELGNSSQWSEQDILFHILAETKEERDKLTDILAEQQDKILWLFDVNKLENSGVYPLDEKGEKVGNLTYQDFVTNQAFRWKTCKIKESRGQSLLVPTPKLFRSTARWTLETIQGSSRGFC